MFDISTIPLALVRDSIPYRGFEDGEFAQEGARLAQIYDRQDVIGAHETGLGYEK